MDKLYNYVRDNRDRLHRLAKHSDSHVQAMAVAILKVAGENTGDYIVDEEESG